MFDVQLLVVDRENRNKQCSVGQIGEIYVRAGGLAEGYLGDEIAELTKTKFVDNWFVEPQRWREQDEKWLAQQSAHEPWRAYFRGPRDRLYRSGDLGRYMPSGDVECTGRADNQGEHPYSQSFKSTMLTMAPSQNPRISHRAR